MKGRTPTADEQQYIDQAMALGCIVCLLYHFCESPPEPHHTDGKTKPECHFKVIPLCFNHHRSMVRNDLYVSRHPYKAEFERRYGSEMYLLEQTNLLLEAVA